MRPRQNPSFQFEELDSGEVVLVQGDTGQALVLNPMGGVIWTMCDGSRTVAEIASFVSSQFAGTATDAVERDVDALVKQLADAGAVGDAEATG